MIGMTTAAIVTGNTVVLKPSSDAAVIAAWFVDLLHEIGVPAGRRELRAGLRQRDRRRDRRRIRRSASSRSPARKRSACASTSWPRNRSRDRSGSSASSRRWAARIRSSWRPTPTSTRPSRASPSRPSAFRDRSVRRARARSSDEPMYDEFVDKLPRAREQDRRRRPGDPANYMGPVVNEGACKSILRYIDKGSAEGRLIAGGKRVGARRVLPRADRHRRRRSGRDDRAGRDLRTGPSRDQGQRLRRRDARSRTTPSSA